ncbi:uncharacterized protein LOC123017884 isoform X1 [Varanus komodoensis]|uniref:uncharacterized protein LOC123017884 isoform X1 n=1 Tax=Varanus komodoensis TaxID=61221 RepID=UPI001CF7C555|nr:uncharacterized protein LOC123017884 isoform X1 [Varanus komodoensis]
MGSWVLWALAAAFAVAAFADSAHGAESRSALWEDEGASQKGHGGTVWLPRTTQRLRKKLPFYRPGSLSVLSRGLMGNASLPQGHSGGDLWSESGESLHRREREAATFRARCRGCCGTQLPNHTGSGENRPSGGDTGPLGSTPSPAPPMGHRPGMYTPIRRMRQPHGPFEEGQAGSISGARRGSPQEAGTAHDRCRGCCSASDTADTEPPGRREEGSGSHVSEGGPSKRVWRPGLGSKRPAQSGASGAAPFPRGTPEPSWPHGGQ